MIVDYWIEDNEVLYVQFNETVIIDSAWQETDWSITIEGPIPPYNFTWELYQKDSLVTTPNNPIMINLTIIAQLYALETLYFEFYDKSTTLSGTIMTQTLSDGFTLPLTQQEDPTGNTCGIETYQIPILALLYTNLGLALISAIFLQSTAIVFHLISCLQIISLAALYQAVFPTCLVDFLQTLSLVGIRFTFFGGSMVSGFVNSTALSGETPYQYQRMGYVTTSVLTNSGDLIFLWITLILVYFCIFALEFVLFSVPYIRTVCQRYRYNFFNAGMNFTFVKVAFDSGVGMLYLQMENIDQLISASVAISVASLALCYPSYIAFHGGRYTKELSMAETDDQVDNLRSNHIFVEYDTSHPACYYYLLTQCIKKAMYVAIALTMYNVYCYGLFLSAIIAFVFLMYYSYVRPFKSALYNLILIFEEFMTFFCFVVLFRYANEHSVENLETSRSTALFFAKMVFVLMVLPAVLALMELINNFKNLSQICNWNRDYQEEKDSFESSEESLKDESVDLLKGKPQEDSLVEKSITIDSSEDGSSSASSGFVDEPSRDEKSSAKSSAKEESKSNNTSIASSKKPESSKAASIKDQSVIVSPKADPPVYEAPPPKPVKTPPPVKAKPPPPPKPDTPTDNF